MCLLIIKQVFRSSYLSQCCEFFCFRKIIRIQLVTRVLSSRVMRSWNFVSRSVIRHVANVILSSFIHYAIFFHLYFQMENSFLEGCWYERKWEKTYELLIPTLTLSKMRFLFAAFACKEWCPELSIVGCCTYNQWKAISTFPYRRRESSNDFIKWKITSEMLWRI